jgi:ABC-2 type transport system ATP-binding protein/lipopolysaccharide transport system ATP-binding protein
MSHHQFHALNNVNLEVKPGEVLGIIGHNGAGKSTLLKVIARVLRPTKGRVILRGRISPLLELGAGFDPELTGRENIYLNSAILGFSKKDITARFNRIVEFAELQEFIDTPVRNYSTGMVSRLGFSVATDVQPEVLIVDEVLSVGDSDFQKRCSERITDFRKNGTTILLVSHDLEAVQKMCDRVGWLEQGELKMCGDPLAVIAEYKKKGLHEVHP